MSEQTRIDFANSVLPDWNWAMDSFFEAVSRRAERDGLSAKDVKAALICGYGYEVADAWDEWVDE